MAVGMYKVVLHQHRKEGFGANIGNQSIHVVAISLIKANGLAINVLLNKDLISGLRVGLGEGYIFIHNYIVKVVNVPFLLCKVQLLGYYLFQRVGSYRNLKQLGEVGKE